MEEFFAVVGVVDLSWCGAVGPAESAGVGDNRAVMAVGDEFVGGPAGEEQFVGIGGASRAQTARAPPLR